jgi:hypothetical protein
MRPLPTWSQCMALSVKASRPSHKADTDRRTTTMLWVAATDIPSSAASRRVPFTPIR